MARGRCWLPETPGIAMLVTLPVWAGAWALWAGLLRSAGCGWIGARCGMPLLTDLK